MQRVAIAANFATEEEYFLFEEKSETRHELINGNLYEISGVSIFHNDIVGNLYVLFRMLLKGRSYKISFESYKYRTPDRNFFYPDLMIFEKDSATKYFSENSVLAAEVLSPSIHKYDLASIYDFTQGKTNSVKSGKQ